MEISQEKDSDVHRPRSIVILERRRYAALHHFFPEGKCAALSPLFVPETQALGTSGSHNDDPELQERLSRESSLISVEVLPTKTRAWGPDGCSLRGSQMPYAAAPLAFVTS